MPELVVGGFAILILLLDALAPTKRGDGIAYLTLGGTLLALAISIQMWGRSASVFNGMLILDRYGTLFGIIFLVGTALTIFLSIDYLKREEIWRGEYYVLLLTATLGMMLMASGGNLLIIFLGLELMSLSLYVLAGFMRTEATSNEAALKYFLLGAFATGFLLYGIAMIYGATGTTDLQEIVGRLSEGGTRSSLVLLGTVLLIVGFGFKIAAVPFHMWTPDVYEGAPTCVTAFLSAGPKAAGFAAFFRVFVFGLERLQVEWSAVLWVLAVLTMSVGNLAAISQRSIKRMLAYSSIAHAGYVMVALLTGSALGVSSGLFYLFAYTLMNLGAFGVIILAGAKGEEHLDLSDYSGLGFRRPLLGLAMAVLMFSLAGFPPTAGFVGKFYIFSAAVEAGFVGLVIIGVLNSLVSVYFYLRVVVHMYMREAPREYAFPFRSVPAVVGLCISVLGTMYIGLFPADLLGLTRETIVSLLP